MKYNRKNLVNNALILGSRDYMKTGFLKGESLSPSPQLFWRSVNANEKYAVNSSGQVVTAASSSAMVNVSGNVSIVPPPSTQISEWGEDSSAENPEDYHFVYNGVEYILDNGNVTPTIEDYQEGESVSEPIAPEGIVQIFADANCTEYADGEVTEVYVRINGGPYEFGDKLELGTGENSLQIITPTNEFPADPFGVTCYLLLVSDDLDGPIEPGTIVRCHSEFSTDCTNFRKIWYGGE